jgi:thioredoxin 1
MKALIILAFALMLSISSCKSRQNDSTKNGTAKDNTTQSNSTQEVSSAKVTFVELGSVNCVPCKQMQPIMKSIEEKYKGQVKVVFHDVWKDKAPAQKYGIQLIPTQVFLDENGIEFFRHEGFYPEEEIDKLMESKGLKAGI